MLAREDHDCNSTREQLDDLVQIISPAFDSARPQLVSLLSFFVPQNHSSDQSRWGLISIPPSALTQQVASFQPSGGSDKNSKQPEPYQVQNPALPTLPPREAEGPRPGEQRR